MLPISVAALVGSVLVACDRHPSSCDADGPAGAGENILVIVSDDIGVDQTDGYDPYSAPSLTPNITALAAQGVSFRNAYASPTCSPSRASLLTGRLPARHGIGRWIYAETSTVALDPSELTLPEALAHSPYDIISAAVGKWHLVGFDRTSPELDPLDQGFDCYAGSLANPLEAVGSGHMPRGYRHWEKDTDGLLSWKRRYMSSDTTDEALARIAHTRSPWFLYVAYNDAHDPLHIPPARLHTGSLGGGATDLELYQAMVQAADTEIGRLLAGIPENIRSNTTIIYLSDNGTPAEGITEPWNSRRSKGSVYEGGVRVPLIVAGPHVSAPGTVSDALVHVMDIFPTVAELADVDVSTLQVEDGEQAGQPLLLDGISLLAWVEDPSLPSGREFAYTEGFYPNGTVDQIDYRRTLRDATHKLIWHDQNGTRDERLYWLDPDAVDEGADLLAAGTLSKTDAAALDRLRAAMNAQVSALP
ncbi:MAG: sulfatase-like hydrolase/transferase [Oligoflexia bacterium]|nr:sulfatase-like hydrolase/transferase [Oligoflexia bacterium]